MSMARRNIVLTGFMGTGKSAVGQALAARLAAPFIDTDALIEQQHGPIPEIFAARGEDGFREIERGVVAGAAASQGAVIATGGGTLLDPRNAQALASSGLIYTLTASPEEIVRRVSTDGVGERPLLEGHEPHGRVTQLLEERMPVYGQFPQVRTDGREAAAIAMEIAYDASNRGVVVLGAEPRARAATSGLSPMRIFLLAFLVVAGFGAAVLFVGRGSDAPAGIARGVADPSPIIPPGAPAGDEFIDVVLVMDDSRGAQREVEQWFGGGVEPGFGGEQIVEGSVVHVANVGSRFGTVSTYRWEIITRWPGEPQQELVCTGEIGNFGTGGQSCHPANFDVGPTIGWGGSGNGRQWVQTISVSGAPDDAAWMTTELQDGWTVVSAVVGGYGYTEFDEFEGQPRMVTLYDADLNEVWSERMF